LNILTQALKAFWGHDLVKRLQNSIKKKLPYFFGWLRLRLSNAFSITLRNSALPAMTAESVSKWGFVVLAMTCARVVLPVPGGPQSNMDENSRSASIALRKSLPGPTISSRPATAVL
jgi:hypothetical protein